MSWARNMVVWLWSADVPNWWMFISKLNTGYGIPYYLESLTFDIGFHVARTDGQTYGHVITKIFLMDRLPNCLPCSFWGIEQKEAFTFRIGQISSIDLQLQ